MVEGRFQPGAHRALVAPAIVEGEKLEAALVMALEQAGSQEGGGLVAEFAAEIAEADFFMGAGPPDRGHGRMAEGGVNLRTGLKLGGRGANGLEHERPGGAFAGAHARFDLGQQGPVITPVARQHPQMQKIAQRQNRARDRSCTSVSRSAMAAS